MGTPTREQCTAILRKYAEKGLRYDRSAWDPEDAATFAAWEAAELARKAAAATTPPDTTT